MFSLVSVRRFIPSLGLQITCTILRIHQPLTTGLVDNVQIIDFDRPPKDKRLNSLVFRKLRRYF